jgi:hypothetical protein
MKFQIFILVYKECSGHGDCNRFKGVCTCHAGYHGQLCDDITDNEVNVINLF